MKVMEKHEKVFKSFENFTKSYESYGNSYEQLRTVTKVMKKIMKHRHGQPICFVVVFIAAIANVEWFQPSVRGLLSLHSATAVLSCKIKTPRLLYE